MVGSLKSTGRARRKAGQFKVYARTRKSEVHVCGVREWLASQQLVLQPIRGGRARLLDLAGRVPPTTTTHRTRVKLKVGEPVFLAPCESKTV